jgi:hypothetical protein
LMDLREESCESVANPLIGVLGRLEQKPLHVTEVPAAKWTASSVPEGANSSKRSS